MKLEALCIALDMEINYSSVREIRDAPIGKFTDN